ncbi:hypothetical protein LOB78_07910 [Lactobacillus delbrueckii subsp. lactis]|uniref:hypothetical protein n=1 Tax=Lactobacillus delbrueckii TaxID=1584 RepID=UPI001E611623|nr:hypothetical protein [Lactobacillus delbrueckii]MCD5444699.1 hypothetical protein [Lactobacillus delbrueckii subsp. lactis]MCD5512723.1 hypothetical protein [Lactobacillus delbrueckii subsp. lactis]
MTPNLTAFTGVDSQNLPDVMVSVQFILAIGVFIIFAAISWKETTKKHLPQIFLWQMLIKY